jgi:hypothetical protein
MAAEYEATYLAFEERAKARAPITYDAVPWPAKGGSAEFVIDFHAAAQHLSEPDRRKLVLQWSRRWHPDTWARSHPLLSPAPFRSLLSRPCPPSALARSILALSRSALSLSPALALERARALSA